MIDLDELSRNAKRKLANPEILASFTAIKSTKQESVSELVSEWQA